MKKIITLFLLIFTFVFTSCEEVIQVDVDTATPRLVVEASINWQKGTQGNMQSIKLTKSTGYFEDVIPVTSGAIVTVTNSSNKVFNFIENQKTGVYVCFNFEPKLNETYTLTIKTNGETYTATEKMYPVAAITKFTQNNNGGFGGKDIEIKTYFNDPADEVNYYLFFYRYKNQKTSNFYADEDSYFNGNEFFSMSQNDSIKVGETINVTHLAISKSYYNYMNIIVNLTGQNGGPFQSPPSTVRGNVVNVTKPDNYPLGFFSVSETDTKEYTVQ